MVWREDHSDSEVSWVELPQCRIKHLENYDSHELSYADVIACDVLVVQEHPSRLPRRADGSPLPTAPEWMARQMAGS